MLAKPFLASSSMIDALVMPARSMACWMIAGITLLSISCSTAMFLRWCSSLELSTKIDFVAVAGRTVDRHDPTLYRTKDRVHPRVSLGGFRYMAREPSVHPA